MWLLCVHSPSPPDWPRPASGKSWFDCSSENSQTGEKIGLEVCLQQRPLVGSVFTRRRATCAFTDLLVISHQHQLDVLGLRQDVSFTLKHRKDVKSVWMKCIMGVGVPAHSTHV